MSTWTPFLLQWLADYYLLATILLALALAAGRLLRQPVQRDFLATATVLGLIALALLCATPTWPRLSLAKFNSTAPIQDLPPAPSLLPPEINMRQPREEIFKSFVPLRTIQKSAPQPIASSASATPAPKSVLHEPPTVHIDMRTLVAAGFVVGAAIVSLWLLIGSLRVRQFCRLAKSAPDFARRELEIISLSLRERAGVRGRRLPSLCISRLIDIAAACGLWRPTILLPTAAVDSDDSANRQSLRTLLAHEYAHIRRGDLWLLAASRLLLVVLFAHPLYWLLRRRLRADQELLADALAAQVCGHYQYAESLYTWARRLPEKRLHLAGAIGIWQRPGQLSRRIAMLLDERIRPETSCPRRWRVSASALAAALVAALSLITLRPASVATAEAADTPQGPKSDADLMSKQLTPPTQSKPDESQPQSVQNPPEKVAVTGVCLDQRKKAIPNAQVRLLRVNHSNTPVEFPSMRVQIRATFPGAKDVEQPGLCSDPRYYAPASQRVLHETRTDAQGRFRFDDVVIDESVCKQSDLMQIVAQSSGYATYIADVCHLLTYGRTPGGVGGWVPKDAAQGAAAKPLELKLQKAVALKGRIIDEAGKPVAGAIVTGPESLVSPVPGVMCAVTDADGRYEINDLPPFNVDDLPIMADWGVFPFTYISQIANVRHPDYAPQILEFSRLPATVDAVLERPAALEGRVLRAENGQLVAEAHIDVIARNGASRWTTTDKQGRYSLAGLLPGKCSVIAKITERPVASSESQLGPGKNSLDLRLVPGGFLKGRVIDDTTGKPVEGQQLVVIASVGEGESARGSSGSPNYRDGTFSFAVHPGKNQVTIFAGPWCQLIDAERWSKTGIDVAEGQTVEIELRVSPPWLVRQLGKLFE